MKIMKKFCVTNAIQKQQQKLAIIKNGQKMGYTSHLSTHTETPSFDGGDKKILFGGQRRIIER